MVTKEADRGIAVRRIWESIIATVVGGLILTATTSLSRSVATTERAVAVQPATGLPVVPSDLPAPSSNISVGVSPISERQTPEAPALLPIPEANFPLSERGGLQSCAEREDRHSCLSKAAGRTREMTDRNVCPPDNAVRLPSEPEPTQSPAPLPPPASVPEAKSEAIPAAIPVIVVPPPTANLVRRSLPVSSVLLYENFSHLTDGAASGWGQNTIVRRAADQRSWLVSNVEGSHTVGCKLWLPNRFSLECRYAADAPDVTRGLLGWWKDPISTKISFVNAKGAKYTCDWTIRCGNDITRLNPLGSSSIYPKKYFHVAKLPDYDVCETEVAQPTGILRIDRDNNTIRVFVNGQAAAIGTMKPMGLLAGFEIDLVTTKNGTLFFTEFKISRLP